MAEHTYPDDCPFKGDHDTIIKMAEQIKAVHYAIYDTEVGVLASFRKVNGRVKKLEIWRAGLAGAVAAMVPILIYFAERIWTK